MSAVLAPSRPPFPAGRDVRLATPGFLRARGITLRPARDDDLPWLRTLYASTRTEELARVPWPDAAKRDFLADGDRTGVRLAELVVRYVDIAPGWRVRESMDVKNR